jgi:hypothetical protein
MRPGEIFLAHFPFGDVPGMKLRPVLLLTEPIGSIPEVLVAYISSVVPTHPRSSDIVVDPKQARFGGAISRCSPSFVFTSWQRSTFRRSPVTLADSTHPA